MGKPLTLISPPRRQLHSYQLGLSKLLSTQGPGPVVAVRGWRGGSLVKLAVALVKDDSNSRRSDTMSVFLFPHPASGCLHQAMHPFAPVVQRCRVGTKPLTLVSPTTASASQLSAGAAQAARYAGPRPSDCCEGLAWGFPCEVDNSVN